MKRTMRLLSMILGVGGIGMLLLTSILNLGNILWLTSFVILFVGVIIGLVSSSIGGNGEDNIGSYRTPRI